MLTNPAVQEILMDITNNEKDSISIIECILNGITFDLEIAEETDIKLNCPDNREIHRILGIKSCIQMHFQICIDAH